MLYEDSVGIGLRGEERRQIEGPSSFLKTLLAGILCLVPVLKVNVPSLLYSMYFLVNQEECRLLYMIQMCMLETFGSHSLLSTNMILTLYFFF